MKKTIRKAFKFRLKVTPEISQKPGRFAGDCRFVWNKSLSLNLTRLEQKLPIMWYEELNFWATLWKKTDEYGFLANLPSQVLQQKLKDLAKAFKDGFDNKQSLKRIPRFKKKGLADSFRYPQGFKVDQDKSKVFLPKLGWVSYRNSRKVVGEAKNITVSRKGKHWYMSIQTEYEVNLLLHKSTSIVGIDMGIKHFATLSDGTVYAPLNSFKANAERLAKLQRQLKNKKKFSNNGKKVKAKINQCHEDIVNARKDYLHKVSTEISENQAIIVIEDLRVKSMSKSSKGNSEQHGKKVAQKSGLNRAILDQGWRLFATMLDYKQDWQGGTVLRVPPHHTSQTCPCCHHVAKENRLTQAEFVCVECGFSENADLVGAMNVLAKGHALLASQ
jgi:putative transposase